MRFWAVLVLMVAVFLALLLTMEGPARAADVDVIAHRGTAYRPENTLEAISNAAYHGAPWVEIDIRCTSSGTLIAMHDATLDATTNGTGNVDDTPYKAIKKLRAEERHQRYRRRSASFDGQFRIPHLAAVLNHVEAKGLALRVDSKTRRCETKMLRVLQAAQDRGATIRFGAADEAQRQLAHDTTTLPLNTVELAQESDVDTTAEINTMVEEAVDQRAVSLSVRHSAVSKELVDAAHAQGLQVDVWTFRAQNRWLPMEYRSCTASTLKCKRKRGRMADWIADEFLPMGIDGVIVDEPNHSGLLP